MRRGRSRRRSRRGAAAVELAVLLPFLTLASLGAVDFGLAFRCVAAVTDCARSGAAAAIDPAVGAAGLDAAIRAAAAGAAADLDVAPTVSWAAGQDAEGLDYVEVTATYEYHGIVGSLSGLSSATIARTVRMMRAPLSGS
ncbi:TadE/TadG family type IV pilus assembly protein [Paludisphaera mucosa]|uniref:TadE/TadG family type IV pilus assembly protein n=1 Tax=Paludisphaera mucosa TaxID=3030827 RepID=A0ABT6FBJ2_9BACT|nr:TadE/TadG family type IV pilus assembly protein [Paludisphaera mucosa]